MIKYTVYSIAWKKNIWTWFIRCTICVEEFFPDKIWWLRIAKKNAFFANFKTEFIFANDGNVDTSRELIFANWSILDFSQKKFSRNWPKFSKFAKINSLKVVTGTIVQQSLARLFNSRWKDCSTVTGTIVQQSLGTIVQQPSARLFNSN